MATSATAVRTCLSSESLHYIGGSSDKLYVVQVEKTVDGASTTYQANCYYGRNGATLKLTQKYNNTSRVTAETKAGTVLTEKLREGYKTMATLAPGLPSGTPTLGGSGVTGAASSGGSSPAPSFTGPEVMLASDLSRENEDAEFSALLSNPNWIMQKKYDGERCVVSVSRAAISAYNKKGASRPLAQNTMDEIKRLVAMPIFGDGKEVILDGEVMSGGDFVAYDILTYAGMDVRPFGFEDRYGHLEVLLTSLVPGMLAPCAWSEAEKRAMLKQATIESWEGLIGRDLYGTYSAGRAKALIRYKLWESVTARVLTRNAKRSVQVGLLQDPGSKEEIACGNVTIPPNVDLPELDSLIEIRYLYAHVGGSLYQPTYKGPRWDKEEADCVQSLRRPPAERLAATAAA